MKNIIVLALVSLSVAGCLKTRAELRGDDKGGATLQKQTQSPPPAPKVDEYDEQLRQLNGRLDAAESRVAQLTAARDAERAGGDQALIAEKQQSEKRFRAYEDALTKLENEVRTLQDELARSKAPAPVAAGKNGDKKTPFEEGETQFNAKKWKDAIVLYQKYRDTYPKGKMFLEATYKIGVCFQELGMKDEARSFYEEVVAKAPKSKEARKANGRMKSLK